MSRLAAHPLWAIVLLGLALRVGWALLVPVMPVSDSAAYEIFARTLVEHGIYGWSAEQPSAYWAVGPSAVTAATFLVFPGYLGVVLINLLSSAALIALGCRLGEIYFGRIEGLASALVLALWPNLVVFVTVLSSELWFITLTLAGLWLWARRGGQGLAATLGAGAFWGAACYMRPVVLLFPVALAIAATPGGLRPLLRQAARAAAAIAVILALVAPWTWRNVQVFGEPVLVSTNFGANFWMGNNPESDGGYMPLPDWVGGLDEVERSDALMAAAMEHVRAEPGLFLARSVDKALTMHAWETIGVAWNEPGIVMAFGDWALLPLKLVLTGYWFLVLALALIGVTVALSRFGVFAALFHPVLGGWAYFTAIHAIVVAGDRYHMPNAPFMALYAGLALAALLVRAMPGRRFETAS